MNNKKILTLHGAHVTQLTGSTGKSDWVIRENITGNDLGVLPGRLTEEEVFEFLRVARKYELIAYNEGIALGKAKTVSVYDQKIAVLQSKVEARGHENNRLADALEGLTRGIDNIENKN